MDENDYEFDLSPRFAIGPFVLRSSYIETVADLFSRLMVAYQQIDVLSRDNVRMRADLERMVDDVRPWSKRSVIRTDSGDASRSRSERQ